MAELEQPIIIKKVFRVEGGHHGGAWKVAYADFVTAMMAFFLLLWLLSTATDQTLQGLAEYFTPTIGLKDQMGIGFEGGQAPILDGNKKDIKNPPGIVVGSAPQGPIPRDPQKKALIEATDDANLFEKGEQSIKKAFESDPNLAEFKDNIIVEQTPEGLKIELVDSDKESMFQPGTAEITDFGKRILAKMIPLVESLPNHISVTGHTDAVPLSKTADYTNWELSAERANSARRFFVRNGMEPDRVAKVVGRASEELLLPKDPKNARNRRISVILLRGSHLEIPLSEQPAPRSLLSVPDADKISRDSGSSGGAYTSDPHLPKKDYLPKSTAPAVEKIENPVDAVELPQEKIKAPLPMAPLVAPIKPSELTPSRGHQPPQPSTPKAGENPVDAVGSPDAQ